MPNTMRVEWIIIGLVVTVLTPILALAVKHWYFDAQRRLRVEIRVWRNTIPRAANECLTAEGKKLRLARDNELDNDRADILTSFLNATSYLEVDVFNKSRKRIDSISVTPTFGAVYQIDDGTTQRITSKDQIMLGNLQPRGALTLHMWTYLNHVNCVELSKFFLVSADEVDRITYRLPGPRYLVDRYKIWIAFSMLMLAFSVWWIGGTVCQAFR
jgi:hypothetical protein